MEISPAGGTNIYDAVLRQSVDDKGLIIYGYDDRAANYIQIGIASTARATITTDQTWLYLDLGGGGYDWALTNTVFYAPPNGYIDANTSFALKFGATTTLLSTASAMKLTPTFGVTIDGSGIPLNVDKDGLVGTTVSGSRYKTNIVEASVGDHVYLMKPKSWDYRKRVPVYGEVKIDGTRDLLGYDYPDEASGYRKLGLIAEDLDAIDPRYINLREADGTAKNYDDRAVINALVQNAKDQKAEIDALQKAVADLANRLEALEAK
uniref:Putative peptidase n=1 Tax=viral metagenome TaxID=1070528 RepID=A0A6M3K8H9_9ZZZZ